MYRLTERRLAKALDILEKYRAQLRKCMRFEAGCFERELCECWGVGYREMKGLAEDMLKNERYRHVAVYYMEHSNTPGVSDNFKDPLSRVYGIKWYNDPDMPEKRDMFWAKFKEETRTEAD